MEFILLLLSKKKSELKYPFLYTISCKHSTGDDRDTAISTSEILVITFTVEK